MPGYPTEWPKPDPDNTALAGENLENASYGPDGFAHFPSQQRDLKYDMYDGPAAQAATPVVAQPLPDTGYVAPGAYNG